MIKTFFKQNLVLAVFLITCVRLYAWENQYTHPAITQQATPLSVLDGYIRTQVGMDSGLSYSLYWNFTSDIEERVKKSGANPNQKTRTILEWIRTGSNIEDEDGRTFPWRPRHHFYDPIRNAGLDNHTDHPNWDAPGLSTWLPLGQSALNWTILGTALQEPFTNNEKWANARSMFYDSLRSVSKSTREAQLAEALLKLGCVLHMLEDMGVPAHTRNDFLYGHYRSVYKWDWKNPLEKWAEEQVDATDNNNIPPGWLTGWTSQPKVLDRISKYWDTGLYLGQYVGATPSSSWGLAEQTNYQFLSMSTVFGCIGTLYQFPQPAESNAILVPELHGSPSKTYRYYQGYGLQHLARQTYSSFKSYEYGPTVVTVTKKTITPDYDVNVYNDYVRVTIPRTIDYATGLLNYFFRGKLSVDANCTCSECDPIEIYITNQSVNTSVNQTLKGGSFGLYWDDNVGNRTSVSGLTVYDSNDPNRTVAWGASTTLAKGNSVRARFNKPSSSNIAKYILVYSGSISANPNDPDPNDPNALAVCTFNPPSPPRPSIDHITPPQMGCPGSILLISGTGFSKTPSHNTVLFEEANSVHSDVYGIVQAADSNGQWLKVELPVFEASTVDYYPVNATVTVDGNTSAPYAYKLSNYIWITITLWDDGTTVDDDFDFYVNGEYWFTFYSTPPEDPIIVEYGFWYEDVYCYVDTYLVESHGESGGTLGMEIYHWVYRVAANRWNNNSQSQEFLYDQDYSGYFNDYFGSDVFVESGDGVELDVYAMPSYTGDLGLTKMAPITISKKKSTVGNGERQGQFSPVDISNRSFRNDIPKKRGTRGTEHYRIRTKDKVKIRQ